MEDKESPYTVKVAMKYPPNKVWTCVESVCSQFDDYYPIPEGRTMLLKPRHDNGLPRIVVSVNGNKTGKTSIGVTVAPRSFGVKTYNRVIEAIRAETDRRYGQKTLKKQPNIKPTKSEDLYFTSWKFDCKPQELKEHIRKVMETNPDWTVT